MLKGNQISKNQNLTGDDLYINNIFRFLDYCEDKSIVFSPSVYLMKKILMPNVSLNLNMSKNEVISLLVKSKNPFSAPGVYINPKLITDDYLNYLSNHADIFREDLPSWYYFFVIKNEDYFVFESPVTIYMPSFINRTNTGTLLLVKFYFRTTFGSIFKRLNSKYSVQKVNRKNIISQLKTIDSL